MKQMYYYDAIKEKSCYSDIAKAGFLQAEI